jgi:hypothetical protein
MPTSGFDVPGCPKRPGLAGTMVAATGDVTITLPSGISDRT